MRTILPLSVSYIFCQKKPHWQTLFHKATCRLTEARINLVYSCLAIWLQQGLFVESCFYLYPFENKRSSALKLCSCISPVNVCISRKRWFEFFIWRLSNLSHSTRCSPLEWNLWRSLWTSGVKDCNHVAVIWTESKFRTWNKFLNGDSLPLGQESWRPICIQHGVGLIEFMESIMRRHGTGESSDFAGIGDPFHRTNPNLDRLHRINVKTLWWNKM